MPTNLSEIDAEVVALHRIADSVQGRNTDPQEAEILRRIASRLEAWELPIEELGFSTPGYFFASTADDPYAVAI